MQRFNVPSITEKNFLGVNNNDPPEILPNGAFTKADNAYVSNNRIVKVPGSTTVASAISAYLINGVTAFERIAASTKWLVVSINGASNAQLYAWNGSGSFAALGSANLTNSKPVYFETALDYLFGFNGTEVVDWNGTTVVKNRTTVPIGYFPKWFHNYLFIGRSDSFPNRLWWSKLGDPTQYAGGIATVSVNAGGAGYLIGDVLNVTSGGGANGQVYVATVAGTAVATVGVLQPGSGYAVTTGATTSAGTQAVSGSGCTINILTVDTTSVTNFVDINPGDGDKCMGLGVLQDELFYFKQNTIWSITGWAGTTFSSTTIAGQNTNVRLWGYGCVAPNSIVSTGNDIYFLSFLGSTPVIRSLKKTQLAQTLGGGIISTNITETMNGMNLSRMDQVQGIFDGRYAMWSIPTGASTTNNQLIVLDTWKIMKISGVTNYPWTTMSGKTVGSFALSTISGKQNVYFSDSDPTGKVFKFDPSVYSDDGVPVTMDVRSRYFQFNPSRKSKFSRMYLVHETGSAGTLQINARVDETLNYTNQLNIALGGNSPGLGPTGTFTLNVSLLGGQGLTTKRVIFKHLTGHNLGVQFLESTANDCRVHYYTIFGMAKGLRAS